MLFIVGLSGCVTYSTPDGGLSGQPPAPVTKTPSATDSKSPDAARNGKEGDAANEPPARKPGPRTLPQAVVSYVHRLPACWRTPAGTEADSAAGKRARDGEEKKGAAGDDPAKDKGQGNGGGTAPAGKKSPNGQEPTETGSAAGKRARAGGEKKGAAGDDPAKEKGQGKGGEAEPPGKKNPTGQEPPEADKEGAKKSADGAKEDPGPSWSSAHGQTTMITQQHGPFRSPYVGTNSLIPRAEGPTSLTATLYLATRLWESDRQSGELVVNPELAGGKGFSNTTGIAGFPNGEIPRVGNPEPTPYFARLFLRQIWGLGGEQELVEDGPNQIAGTRDVNRLTLQVGKMAATDIADNNRYSHDPRTQFMPWSMMFNGAWDYPANVRGYTYGIALDYNQVDWALRYGIFAMPAFANGAPFDPHFLKAHGQVLEWEGRYLLNEHRGAVRLMAYTNRARMGNYAQALAEMPVNPDVIQTRDYRSKYGFGANFDQELTPDLGLWGRLGWNDGRAEAFAFAVIDRTAALGLLLKGRRWCRPQDQVGLAVCVNGLSGVHRDYLAAGGLDFMIGDGRLRYAPEGILEIYYNLQVAKGIQVTTDFQGVNHPAYNADRGPVAIASLRVHFDY